MGIPNINCKNIFNLDESQNILPVVWRITDQTNQQFQILSQRLEVARECDPSLVSEIDLQIDVLIDRWKMKLRKLGVYPKGLWMADFDNGAGYYCWKFPEKKITHWHGYQDGFIGRKMIASVVEAVR